MKKVVLSILLFWPLFLVAQSVDFTKSWVEYDIEIEGKTGMNFHYSFTIHNYLEQNMKAVMFIGDSNNTNIPSYDNEYKSKQGSICSSCPFTPKYKDATFYDFKLFVPYDAMPIAKKNTTYNYFLDIRTESDDVTIKRSNKWTLDWASHSPNARIKKVWSEHNKMKNNESGMLIHAEVDVNNNKGLSTQFCCFFYDESGNNLKTTKSEYSTVTGELTVFEYSYPNYKNTTWNDYRLFIPYSLFPNNPKKNNYTFRYYIRDPGRDYSVLASSEPYSFWLNFNSQQNDYDKPIIEWLAGYESNSASFLAKAGIKSSTTLTQTNLSVNGTMYRGMKTVKNDGYQMVINENITLHSGTNDITITATNANGTTTQTFKVIYKQSDSTPTTIENLIALVIGNANYPSQSLKTPVNDANDIAASLRQHGFEVITLTNGTKRQIENAIAQLRSKANKNSVALFYYAGHGIQKDGRNYLVPIDADPQNESDVEYTCTDINRVLANMEASGCTRNIIVLDACRNNPFERSWTRGTTTRGLTTIDAPDGTFISYATSPGKVAFDGSGRNSPYAESLLQSLETPQIELYDLFRQVNADVKSKTNGAQSPWISTNFNGKFYF